MRKTEGERETAWSYASKSRPAVSFQALFLYALTIPLYIAIRNYNPLIGILQSQTL